MKCIDGKYLLVKHAHCSSTAGAPHQILSWVVVGIDPLWHSSFWILTFLCKPLHAGCFVWAHFSKCLGSSKKDRETHVWRIGYLPSKIVHHVSVVVCSVVSPCRATRNDERTIVGKDHFVDVYEDTPLDVCEQRDVKGLNVIARCGEIKGFTMTPSRPPHTEIRLDTAKYSPEENACSIADYLSETGLVVDQE